MARHNVCVELTREEKATLMAVAHLRFLRHYNEVVAGVVKRAIEREAGKLDQDELDRVKTRFLQSLSA